MLLVVLVRGKVITILMHFENAVCQRSRIMAKRRYLRYGDREIKKYTEKLKVPIYIDATLTPIGDTVPNWSVYNV
jgi:hypothetical protein